MKQTIINFILLIVLLIVIPFQFTALAYGGSNEQKVKLRKERKKLEKEVDCEGKRMPSRSIDCTINEENGVIIYDYCEEILSYELWVEPETCIATYDNERDFMNHLFSQRSEYLIKFQTEDYYYTGYIEF